MGNPQLGPGHSNQSMSGATGAYYRGQSGSSEEANRLLETKVSALIVL